MLDLDRSLFLLLNGSPGASPWLVALAVLLAKYVIVLVPLHMALIWLGGDRFMRYVALTALLALVGAIVVNQAIGLVAYRPRPFVIGLGHVLIEHRDSSSMPSNHGTVFFVYAITLAIFGRRGLALVFGGLGLAVAWSRIFLGVHYPGDMVVAAIVSLGSALLATWFMGRMGATPLRWAERATDVVAGPIASRFPSRPHPRS